MFSQVNRNKNKQQSEDHIRDEAHADEIVNLNPSIGNQAMIENILDLEKLEEKNSDPDDSGSIKDLPLISEKGSVSINLNTNKYKNKPLLDLPLLNPDLSKSKKERPRIKFNIMNDDESEDSGSIKEENASEKSGPGFIAGIIASVNGRHNGAGDNIEEDNISELFPQAGKNRRACHARH